ncbi:MAG: hypothetical protein Q7R54_01420 [bacterium]|nr:hypothetical protein [bacterium]
MNNQVGEPGIIAIHEAGHVVMAWLMGFPLLSAEISEMGGCVNLNPFLLCLRPPDKSWEFAQKTIRLYLAGRCAERIFFGFSCDPNSREDVSLAENAARFFGRSGDIAALENEAYKVLVAHKETVRGVAERLEKKKTLFFRDLAIMQAEFARDREQLILAA